MFKFEERTALITGGAGGIGLSIAKALGEQKMNIVLTDVDEKNLLQSAAELELFEKVGMCYSTCKMSKPF